MIKPTLPSAGKQVLNPPRKHYPYNAFRVFRQLFYFTYIYKQCTQMRHKPMNYLSAGFCALFDFDIFLENASKTQNCYNLANLHAITSLGTFSIATRFTSQSASFRNRKVINSIFFCGRKLLQLLYRDDSFFYRPFSRSVIPLSRKKTHLTDNRFSSTCASLSDRLQRKYVCIGMRTFARYDRAIEFVAL